MQDYTKLVAALMAGTYTLHHGKTMVYVKDGIRIEELLSNGNK